jgi:hypothetical protein
MEGRHDSDKILIRKTKEILAEKGTYLMDLCRPTLQAFVKESWPPNPQTVMEQHGLQATLPFSQETKLKLNAEEDHHIEVDCSECSGSGENRWGGSCRGCNGIGKIGVEK